MLDTLSVPLIAGGCLLLAVYAWISLTNLRLALILSVMAAYNPFFSDHFLFAQAFRGGRQRVLLSALAVIVLFCACVIKQPETRAATAGSTRRLFTYMVAWLIFPLLGALVGLFFAGYPSAEVGAELLPLVEFVAYFYVAARIMRHPRDVRTVALYLALWVGLVSAIEVVRYSTSETLFALRVPVASGLWASRLTDFMLPILLPVGFAFSVIGERKLQRRLTAVATICMGIAVWLSFYRTIWVSTGAALALWALLAVKRGARLQRTAPTLLRAALVAVLMLSVSVVLIRAGSPVIERASLASVLSRFDPELLLGPEASSVGGRIDFVRDIIAASLASPWGQGMGAPFYSSRTGGWLRISDSPVLYLKLLYQLGVVPFALYVLLFGLVVREALRAFWRTRAYNGALLSAGVIGGLFGACVSLLVFPAVLHFPVGPCSAVLLVCVLTAGKPVKNPVESLQTGPSRRLLSLERHRGGALVGNGLAGHTGASQTKALVPNRYDCEEGV